VRSYRTFSPLPLALRKAHAKGGSFSVALIPGVAPAGRYPAPFFRGARTFLHRSLSAIAAAVTQPTDWAGLGICWGHVNKTLKSQKSGPFAVAV
jgi:hypothetical protein